MAFIELVDPMKINWNLQMKLFAIFSVGVILPGVVLTYLGFRSIGFEKHLAVTQAQERYGKLREQLEKEAAHLTDDLQKTLQKKASHPAFENGSSSAQFEQLLNSP